MGLINDYIEINIKLPGTPVKRDITRRPGVAVDVGGPEEGGSLHLASVDIDRGRLPVASLDVDGGRLHVASVDADGERLPVASIGVEGPGEK